MSSSWGLHSRLVQAEARARDARHDVLEQELVVRELAHQVDRLTVVVLALAEILRDRHGTPAEVIEEKIREVERRGVTFRLHAKRCDECDRISSPERKDCMFCGKPLPSQPFLSQTSGSS